MNFRSRTSVRIASLLLALTFLGSPGAETARAQTSSPPQAAPRQITLHLASDLPQWEKRSWIAYGSALFGWTGRDNGHATAPPGRWTPPPEVELLAREEQVKIWKLVAESGTGRFPYMDQMVTVADAGYLREYIWTHHRHVSWGRPAADLRSKQFQLWSQENIPQHAPRTGAVLEFGPRQ